MDAEAEKQGPYLDSGPVYLDFVADFWWATCGIVFERSIGDRPQHDVMDHVSPSLSGMAAVSALEASPAVDPVAEGLLELIKPAIQQLDLHVHSVR